MKFYIIMLVTAANLVLTAVARADEAHLTIMSFNVWGAGQNAGKTTAETIAAIRAAQADLVGLQEVCAESVPCRADYCPPRGPSAALEIAAALGFDVYQQEQTNDALWANAILSRYPILGASKHALGIRVDVHGQEVWLFNIHPTDYPYQPYQLLGIPYGAAPFIRSADEAVRYASRTRSSALQLLRQDLATVTPAALTIITGDFNEPSRLDWTDAAVSAGLQPLAVPWPLTQALAEAGFVDAFRSAHPDVVAKPGFTWSPLIATDSVSADSLPADALRADTPANGKPQDHRDRIDFIFVRGESAVVNGAAVVGESSAMADIVVTPWPSDHRAVVAHISSDQIN